MTPLLKLSICQAFMSNDLSEIQKKSIITVDKEQYLTTLVEIQQHFLKNSPDCYQKVLELLGKVTGSSYIQLSDTISDRPDHLTINLKASWYHPTEKTSYSKEIFTNLSQEWLETLKNGSIVEIRQEIAKQGLITGLILPIMGDRQKLTGILTLINPQIDNSQETWIKEYLQQLTQAIGHFKKQEKSQTKLLNQSRQAALTSDISFALAQSETLQELLQCCSEAILQHLEATSAQIWLLNPEENLLELQAQAGLETPIETQYNPIPVGQLTIGKIAQTCQPYTTNNILDDSQMKIKDWAQQENIIAFAGYPLIVETKIVGVMNIFAKYPLASSTFQTLASISDQIASGIEHQLAQTALKKSQERYQAIVEDQTELICRFLPTGKLSFVNEAFCRYFNRSKTDLIGTIFIPEIVKEDQETVKNYLKNLLELNQENSVINLEFRVIINHQIRWLQWTHRAILNQQRKLIEFQAIGRDITELVEAKEIAQQASKMKSQFLATMSHEIRTPMNGVIGIADLLARTPLNPQQKDYVQTLKSSSKSLLSIINDILDFSKLEAGEMTLENLAFDLNTCLGEVIDLLSYQAKNKGLKLSSWIDPQVPFFLKGDPLRLRQILLNLVGNSLKFTDKGEVKIKVSLETENHSDPKLKFEIQDTGIGISLEDQQKLFKSFSQVDNSTTRKYGGTGLGLAICQQLVELMGGEIGVNSTLGVGSTFWFTTTCENPSCPLPEITAENAQLKGLKILVLDHLENYSLIQTYSNSWGIECYHAENAETAIDSLLREIAAGRSYDIVLIDLDNPNLNGQTLAQLMQADPDLSSLHCFLMTKDPQNILLQNLINQGFKNYLLKPIRPSQLSEILNSIFDHGENIILSPISDYKILVAEDTTINQKVILSQLEILGYQAECVNNGQEVLDKLGKMNYDLILMDCLMPVLDGYQTTKLIRQQENPDQHQTIIAMTANAFRESQEECLAAGMDDYISKPVTLDILEAILKRWLPEKQPLENSIQTEETSETIMLTETPIDLEQLSKITGGDQDFQKEVLTAFLEEAPRYIDRIKQAIFNKDSQELMESAHQLKGAANMSGIREMPIVARDLEILSNNYNSEKGLVLLDQLEIIFKRVQSFITGEILASSRVYKQVESLTGKELS
jgi:PAS domain S-box-containing protein